MIEVGGQVFLKEPVTARLTDHLAVKLYPDCRPSCLETASLQKGLVLMLDDRELIEEGMGFGLPIAKYSDKTFFASSAQVSTDSSGGRQALTKTYVLDTVSRKKLSNGKYIDDGFYSFARKKFAKLYLNKKSISPLFNKIMELRNLARIKTEFVRVNARGIVTATYQLEIGKIKVKVDFSGLNLTACKEMLILNEQGSGTFERYQDANGLTLVKSRIGGWDGVDADWASMLSWNGNDCFNVRRVKDAKLFRGWERTKNRFSWAGLNYSIVPNCGIFEYEIEFELPRRKL